MTAKRGFPSRRAVLAGGACAAIGASWPARAVPGDAAVGDGAAASDLIWGVNGHPFTAYPGVSFEEQLALVEKLSMRWYRVNLHADHTTADFETLLGLAQARGITLLPILEPEGDFDTDDAETIRALAYDHGRAMARRFAGRVPVWELSNELESYAIIQPCEMRDDGTRYPCEWGPAGGVDALDYVGARWAKVSATLDGLSRGVADGDPSARRAAGAAGWGHLGMFERLVADGVAWDITVWHDYQGVSDEYLGVLAGYGKPIWLTEFNAGSGGFASLEDNARMLGERMAYYHARRARFGIEAAFVYELLDETYWGDDFEARMGLFTLVEDGAGGWRVGPSKPAAAAVRDAIEALR